eukprot:CAMPEP_0114997342 /NCGR_PEP_ID=MMETSP0216-20121206/14844_1 /TAXON_ID=223996 /ORGANISM="Protocruzia adherens, Strain Boccale" /LENGTH=231 /DNA_ID=CAMNT_0002361709 /DNA_START=327 /DNA_END=1022 /DNA_ORIENTATION=+
MSANLNQACIPTSDSMEIKREEAEVQQSTLQTTSVPTNAEDHNMALVSDEDGDKTRADSDSSDSDGEGDESRRRRKKYSVTDNKTREDLIKMVETDNISIKRAAEKLGINYSTAKSILGMYKKEGRIQKKTIRKRTKDGSKTFGHLPLMTLRGQLASMAAGQGIGQVHPLLARLYVQQQQMNLMAANLPLLTQYQLLLQQQQSILSRSAIEELQAKKVERKPIRQPIIKLI